MKTLLSNKYFLLCSRLVLGVVFVVASIDKIAYPDAFGASIEAYRLIPLVLVNIIALMIPWLELVCGIFLVSGVLTKGSSTVATSLLGVFTLAIISAILRELKIDCGCFGKEHSTPVGWMRVAEDVGLLLLGIHVMIYAPSRRQGVAVDVPPT